MKRTKRKYTRKVVGTSEESKSSGNKEESGTITHEFSFDALPLSIRRGVEKAIEMRKWLKLADDSEERKESAVRYFRGSRPR